MDDDLAGGVGGGSVPARAQSLDDAIQSFNALSTSNSKYDTVWDVSQRHWQQQQWQQLKQEEEWVQTWRGLLDRARRTLANTLTPEAAAAAAAAAGSSIAAADIDMQIEAELEAVYASAAAKAVAESEQVATLQKMIDEVASQQWEVKGRAAVDQQVSEELFATGVTLVEQAMDLDDDMKHLQDKIQQQQAATAAAEKAKAEEAARKQAEDAALIAAMETELDTWYLEQIALDEQRQQQQEEEAAAAAAVVAESERRQQSADFNAIAAFEDMMLDLDMSFSSNTSGNASGSGKTVASQQQHQHKLTSSQHKLTSSSSSRDRSSGNKTSANVVDDLEQLMESVDIDDLLPAPQQQQRQKQPLAKQHGANGIKFRMM